MVAYGRNPLFQRESHFVHSVSVSLGCKMFGSVLKCLVIN
jgi:hypothetical protein